jgi:hypothetical protein
MGYNPPLIFGPIPAESNPPINPQYYEPSRFEISALGLGLSTLVTTSVDHNYVLGQLIRLLIPFTSGSTQLNEQPGYVINIPAPNQVVVNIYSANANPFIPATPTSQAVPQIIAIGDINTGSVNMGRTNNGLSPPGSFINISPI